MGAAYPQMTKNDFLTKCSDKKGVATIAPPLNMPMKSKSVWPKGLTDKNLIRTDKNWHSCQPLCDGDVIEVISPTRWASGLVWYEWTTRSRMHKRVIQIRRTDSTTDWWTDGRTNGQVFAAPKSFGNHAGYLSRKYWYYCLKPELPSFGKPGQNLCLTITITLDTRIKRSRLGKVVVTKGDHLR